MAHGVIAPCWCATYWYCSSHQLSRNLHQAYYPVDDGASYLDEPPETPAPLFAVRAFKTAIFGTPVAYQRLSKIHEQPKAEKDREKDAPQAKLEDKPIGGQSDDRQRNDVDSNKPAATLKLDSLASPTKGILLTPGTAATRRKTVSFGEIERKKEVAAKESTEGNGTLEKGLGVEAEKKEHDEPFEDKPRQSKLTKTLIELSKQKTTNQDSTDGTKSKAKKPESKQSIDFLTDSVLQLDADMTLDLNQPRSTSGQHWKGEYDQYHRRSNREMKTIIKYGQNVRSFAAKKDTEATRLSERLRKQMAKTAEMEAKMTVLENELSSARAQGLSSESDRDRPAAGLVSQKRATDGNKQQDSRGGGADASEPSSISKDTKTDVTDLSSLHSELESLRRNAKAAEDQTSKLEKENAALKLSLARVKNEMMSYETRRQARELRMKKREAKHQEAREECEKKLAKLTVEHEELLRTSVKLPEIDMMAEVQSIQQEAGMQIDTGVQRSPRPEPAPIENKENSKPLQNGVQITRTYISPRKKRLQKPAVDIWTLSSSQNGNENSPASKEPTELPPSSVQRDVQRTLKEIDQNLVPNRKLGIIPAIPSDQSKLPEKLETNRSIPSDPSKLQPSPEKPASIQPPFASAVRRMHNRKTTISSPRPSMISLESSPAKAKPENSDDQSRLKPSMATTGRSASLMSGAGSRTSTMGSGRVSTLPAERVSAAKQRLAGRMEKRRRDGVER